MINRMNRVNGRLEEDTSPLASAVRYDADQIRSEDEKAQARANMGAISAAQLADTKADLEAQIENISGISDPEAVSQMVEDVAKHEEDISALKSSVTLVNDGYYSFDLIPNKYIEKNDGSESDYSGWSASDFIPVPDNSIVVLTTPTSLTWGALYDKNKQYISAYSWPSGESRNFFHGGELRYFRFSGISPDMKMVTIRIIPIVVEDYVTPEMFGAKGDGVTYDTQAIQAAINSGKNVIFGTKTYLIGSSIALTGSCPGIENHGTIKYTGSDYAFVLSNCIDRTYCFGVIRATVGGCIKIDSTSNFSQYISIYFTEFSAVTDCVYLNIPANWINEVRFFNGKLAAGAYGVRCVNSASTSNDHFIFSEVGFEGVTTGIHLDGIFSNVACYGCRMEESTTNLLTSTASALSSRNSFFWYGRLSMLFLQNAGKFPVYVIGQLFNVNGDFIATKVTVFNGYVYGDLHRRQNYYASQWADISYKLSISMNDILTNGTVIRTMNSIEGQTCIVEIEKGAIFTGTMFHNEIYILLGDIVPNSTIKVQTDDGLVIKTYTASSSTLYKTLKISYIPNWGITCEEVSMTNVVA